MVSTTDSSKMMNEFTTERAATLAKLPAEISPSDFVKIATGGSGSIGTGTSGAAEDPVDGAGSILGLRYSLVALILLGANLTIGVVLVGMTAAICVQGRKNRLSMRTVYAPVRFKDDIEQGSSKYGS